MDTVVVDVEADSGGVTGAATQVLGLLSQAWWLYGQKQVHAFWWATGAIAGCLCGGVITPFALWRLGHSRPSESVPGRLLLWIALLGGAFLWGMKVDYKIFASSLLSKDPAVRAVAQTLVFHVSTRPKMLARALASELGSRDAPRRWEVLETLAVMGPTAQPVAGHVRKCLADPDPRVRTQSALTLRAIEHH